MGGIDRDGVGMGMEGESARGERGRDSEGRVLVFGWHFV